MLVKFCNLRAYGKFVMLSLAFFPRLFMASGLTVCRSCILFYVPMSAAPDAHVRILLANHGPRVRPGVGEGYCWEFQLMGAIVLINYCISQCAPGVFDLEQKFRRSNFFFLLTYLLTMLQNKLESVNL